MDIGGIRISEELLKQILAEKELIIYTISKLLDQANAQLSQGYNMKLTKLPDGRIILEPEGNELEVLQWVEQKFGVNALKEQIQTFINQRIQQKEYDALMAMGAEMKELTAQELSDVVNTVKDKAKKNRELKAARQLEQSDK